jgi:hypothetical protein
MSLPNNPKTPKTPKTPVRPPLILNEVPEFHPSEENINDTLKVINDSFLLQLQKLNSSRRSSLSDNSLDKFAQFGTWKYIWGEKITPHSENDKGLLNVGKIIGKEFIIHKAIMESKDIKSNLSYRIDYDEVVGKHINTIELFKDTLKKESSPQFKSNVKKAHLYNEMLRYLYFEKSPMPIGEDRKRLDDFIASTQDEPNTQMIIHTNVALKSGEKMSPKLANDILQAFTSDKYYLQNYFKGFKSSLRPLIDCARFVYLKNEGNPTLEKDDYADKNVHSIVNNYIRLGWKEDAIELVRELHKMDRNLSSESKLTDEEKANVELERFKIIEEYSNSQSANTLINEIYHAIHGHTGKEEVRDDLIQFFSKKLKLFNELFEILAESSDGIVKDSILEFQKILFNPTYRESYLAKYKDDVEPLLMRSNEAKISSQPDDSISGEKPQLRH